MRGVDMLCFLDVDGVLADWVGGVHERMGIDYDYSMWPYAKGPAGWDFHDEAGFSFADIDAMCDFDLWANLRWMHDGHDIMRLVVQHFGKNNIRLLTAPMPNVMSASGKMEWIGRNLPEYKRQVTIHTGDKAVLAKVPDSILIDDSSKNVDAWRAVGGKAILVPRWWNTDHYHANNTVDIVWSRIEYGGL